MAGNKARICPECGGPEEGRQCLCGYQFASPSAKDTGTHASKRSPWLAILPALIVLGIGSLAVVYSAGKFSGVADVIVPRGSRSAGKGKLNCVETYGVTMQTSEFYVREGSLRLKNAPKELSTLLRGMARNGCGEPLKKVRIRITVRDDEGKRGAGWAEIPSLGTGQVASFEKAWMGRVTSYEIGDIR